MIRFAFSRSLLLRSAFICSYQPLLTTRWSDWQRRRHRIPRRSLLLHLHTTFLFYNDTHHRHSFTTLHYTDGLHPKKLHSFRRHTYDGFYSAYTTLPCIYQAHIGLRYPVTDLILILILRVCFCFCFLFSACFLSAFLFSC